MEPTSLEKELRDTEHALTYTQNELQKLRQTSAELSNALHENGCLRKEIARLSAGGSYEKYAAKMRERATELSNQLMQKDREISDLHCIISKFQQSKHRTRKKKPTPARSSPATMRRELETYLL